MAREDDTYDLYQRIDQEELEKLGVSHKSQIDEGALPELRQYTLLQRLRNGRDLKAVDKYKPVKKPVNKENVAPSNPMTQKLIEKKKEKAKEKDRYMKALQAIVYSKNERQSEIPHEIQAIEDQMMASNSQFYQNEKEYQKVVKGILTSLSQQQQQAQSK